MPLPVDRIGQINNNNINNNNNDLRILGGLESSNSVEIESNAASLAASM